MNQIEETFSCKVPCKLEFVAKVLHRIESYCLARGLSPETWTTLRLPIDEGMNNAIIHGGQNSPDQFIEIFCRWQEDTLEFCIQDPGHRYLPAEGETPALPKDVYAESGRGNYIMHQTMDEVRHELLPGRHQLYLRKKVGKANPNAFRDMSDSVGMITDELRSFCETISALFRLGEALATTLSFEVFAKDALQQLIVLLQSDAAQVRLLNADSKLELISSTEIPFTTVVDMDSDFQEAIAFRSNYEVTVEDCSLLPKDDPLYNNTSSAVVYPITFQDQKLGTLTVLRNRELPFFTYSQINLGRVVSDFVGIAYTMSSLQKVQSEQIRNQREIEISAQIQSSLLPKTFPVSPHYQIHGMCQSAKSVGGDFFDVIRMGTDGLLLVIADVMGKGIPASLYATVYRTIIRSRVHPASRPASLLQEANTQICNELSQVGMFITSQIVFLDFTSRELQFASAGHCPLFLRSGNDILELTAEGTPLGINESEFFESARSEFRSGDSIMLLTDGLYEVFDLEQKLLEHEEFKNMLHQTWRPSPQTACPEILNHIKRYAGDQPASDDQTLLIVEML